MHSSCSRASPEAVPTMHMKSTWLASLLCKRVAQPWKERRRSGGGTDKQNRKLLAEDLRE
jgi:hypothetical protein